MSSSSSQSSQTGTITERVLTAVGLGLDSAFFEGQQSAISARLTAARKLPEAILLCVSAGARILPPYPAAMRLVEFVAEHGEKRPLSVAITHKFITRAIALHIRMADENGAMARTAGFERGLSEMASDLSRDLDQDKKDRRHLDSMWNEISSFPDAV